jgi:hypothetical protein
MSDRFVGFWSQYQPDLREAELTYDVRLERYAREPDIPEMAEFDRWRARDVLEVGCGIGSDALSFAEGRVTRCLGYTRLRPLTASFTPFVP